MIKSNRKGQVGDTFAWIFAFIVIFIAMILLSIASGLLFSAKTKSRVTDSISYVQGCVYSCIKNNVYDYCCVNKHLVAFESYQLKGMSGEISTCQNSRFRFEQRLVFQTYCLSIHAQCSEVNCIANFKK